MNKIEIAGKVVRDLNGDPIMANGEMLTVANQIATALSMERKGDALKLWGLAQRFNTGEDLELDDSDLKTVKDVIEAIELSSMVKAQCLAVLG